jgi:quinol monooxygenase YgiN
VSEIITVIARVEANKDDLDLVKAEAIKLVEPTRHEDGCIEYSLQQDNENPAILIFVERWQSKQHLHTHLESVHLKNFVKAIDKCVISFTVNEMSSVN